MKRIPRRSDRRGTRSDSARPDWPRAVRTSPDVLLGCLLALVAVWAFLTLPGGSTLRIVLVAPVLLLVPGYVLIQALVVPAPGPARRAVQAVVAIGASPALVALAALATAIVPGGFRPGPIVGVVTFVTLGLAAAALYRRAAHAAAAAEGIPNEADPSSEPQSEPPSPTRPEMARDEAAA